MFWFILKFAGKILKQIHSGAKPSEIGGGVALGAIVGLTPFWCLHNLVVFLLIMIIKVNIGMAIVSAVIFGFIAFAIDPLANTLGYWLMVDFEGLRSFWTTLYNIPIAPLTRFNNTIVLGSLIISLALFYPIYRLAIYGVKEYRTHLKDKIDKIPILKALKASRFIQWYLKVSGIGR